MRISIVVLALLGLLAFSVPPPCLAAGGEILGAVLSQNSVLLEGAEVELEGVGRTTTDSQGHFTFSGVPPGNYRLTASKPGFPATTRALSVRAGATERVEVMLAGFAERPRAQGERVAVPLLRSGNSFFVRALVNGRRQVIFVLDTGASLTTISQGLAKELGLAVGPGSPTVALMTASGRVEAPVSSVETIEVGGAEARNVQVAVLDLPGSSQLVGLLGNTFLSQFRVQLDPAQGVLTLGW
ncbi:MAG TPA: aspartyl protease family protein [Candidatus Methylomirabilis sp.]|nr:aspartyl protease family protein [Candidatus Methylomirabilis sp.]